MRKILIMLFLLIFAKNAYAAAYYVGKTGCNDSGTGLTMAQPFCTISKGVSKLAAGDALAILYGTYNQRLVVRKSGTSSLPITITGADPANPPTLDGTGLRHTEEGVIDLLNSSNIILKNVKVTNSSFYGIHVTTSSFITVLNVAMLGSKHGGIVFDQNSSDVSLSNSVVTNSDNCGKSCGIHEAVTLSNTHRFRVFNNEVHHGAMEGIDAKDGSTYGEVYDNHVYNMGSVGLYFNHCRFVRMYRNNVHHIGTDGVSFGVGDSAMGSAVTSDNELFQNLIWNNGFGDGGLGIFFYQTTSSGVMKNNKIYNNVIYKSKYEGISNDNLSSTAFSGNVIRNNIIMENAGGIDPNGTASTNTFSNNLFWKNGWSEKVGVSNVTADPLFINPIAGNFYLSSGSPAINKGFDMGLPKNGLPDIGRWEYGMESYPDGSVPVADARVSDTLKPDAAMCLCPCGTAGSSFVATKVLPLEHPPTPVYNTDDSGCSVGGDYDLRAVMLVLSALALIAALVISISRRRKK